MKELEKDMTHLRSGMKECGREVEFYRSQPVTNGDRYLPVMKEFMTMASVRLAELEDLFVDMKARVRKGCCKKSPLTFCFPCSLDLYQSFESTHALIGGGRLNILKSKCIKSRIKGKLLLKSACFCSTLEFE